MDLNGAGISTFYKVKDYVSAASTIGQNNCGFSAGGLVMTSEQWADVRLVDRPRGHGQVLHHQRESRF